MRLSTGAAAVAPVLGVAACATLASMRFDVDITPEDGADPIELADQILDYLCGGEVFPSLIASCDAVDPVNE